MIIKAIAIDDEPPAIRVIETYCQKTGVVNELMTFTKPGDAIAFVEQQPVDLVFLDIEMPSASGIEVCKLLRGDPMIIFTTAYSEYAVDGFNLNVIDFLLKPYSYQRFEQAIRKVQKALSLASPKIDNKPDSIFIKTDQGLTKVNMDEIIYIEGCDNYIKINLANRKNLIARMTLKGVCELLPPSEFVRVHKSFVMALGKIRNIQNRIINTLTDDEVMIGKCYHDCFSEAFKKYISH